MLFKKSTDKGERIPKEFEPYFTGKDVFLSTLTDDKKGLVNRVTNVTFGKGIRNIWHSHEGGQILVVTSGKGYYQEFGKEKILIELGDVITIAKDVIHWHGATEDSEMSHIYITGDPKSSPVVWRKDLEK